MKKRGIALLLAGLMTFIVMGCSESSTNGGSNQSGTTEQTEEAKENRQTILENDMVKIEYVKTVKNDYETDLVFHAENKSDQNIIIQPDSSISLDDTMYSVLGSQDLMAGKKADFKATLSSSDGSDLNIPDFSKASGTIKVLNEGFETITEQTFDVTK